MNIIERGELEEESEGGDEVLFEPDGDDNDGDHEEQILVVRKMMLASRGADSTQCHQLFQTRCTIKFRICNLIIDGDSEENIIKKMIVKKLQPPVEKHPNP